MQNDPCPRCGSCAAVPGKIVACGGAEVRFVPTGTEGFLGPFTRPGPSPLSSLVNSLIGPGIRLPDRFLSCTTCGHLWSNVDRDELCKCIRQRGTELVKQRLERAGHGPDHGLPDSPAARDASQKVGEIDDLVMAGDELAPIRRFHELSGAGWDQAYQTVHRWSRLKRAEKLALFGWPIKAKPDACGLDSQDQSMRDRELDG